MSYTSTFTLTGLDVTTTRKLRSVVGLGLKVPTSIPSDFSISSTPFTRELGDGVGVGVPLADGVRLAEGDKLTDGVIDEVGVRLGLNEGVGVRLGLIDGVGVRLGLNEGDKGGTGEGEGEGVRLIPVVSPNTSVWPTTGNNTTPAADLKSFFMNFLFEFASLFSSIKRINTYKNGFKF